MASPNIKKIRTANLPHFQLTAKEVTHLMAIVAIANFIVGILIGFVL